MTTITPVAGPSGWELVPLADQFANHDEFRPKPTDDLVGTRSELMFRNGPSVELDLCDPDQLSWRADGPFVWGAEGNAEYEAVLIRPSVYALIASRLADHTSALIILDQAAHRSLVNLTTFEDTASTPRERTDFYQAGLGREDFEPFAPTTELIGKRVAHRYSTTHVFEHIYLNPNTYAFQGLAGPEAGVADVDRADYWKLADQLYLFSWHERAQPFNGAVVLDLAAGRATGRLVGWDAQSERTLQVRTGSIATLLSTTSYENL